MAYAWPKQTLIVLLAQLFHQIATHAIQLLLMFYLMQTVGLDPMHGALYAQMFILISVGSTFIGAILADGFLGKFATIFYMNIICIVGLVLLGVAANFPLGNKYHPYLDFAGLLLWAVGSGGVRPTLSTFGADQFKSHYVSMISTYFAIYFLISEVGRALSQNYMPVFKVLPCLHQNTCYPIAFGMSALFVFLSLLAFCTGVCLYKPSTPAENVILRALNAIKIALYCKFKGIGAQREHWLDYYLNAHDCTKSLECIQASRGRPVGAEPNCPHAKFLDEIKAIFRVSTMFAPIPVFWALYQQQNPLWLAQGSAMDIHMTPTLLMTPDHMFLVALLLLLLLVPAFQCFIYPLFGFCGIRITYLRRMIIGGLFAVLAFGFSAVIQMGVNQTLPQPPDSSSAVLSIINVFPTPTCKAMVADVPGYVTAAIIPGGKSLVDNPLTAQREAFHVPMDDSTMRVAPGIQFNGTCSGHSFIRHSMNLEAGALYYVVVGAQGIFSNKAEFQKPREGNGMNAVSINFAMPCKFAPESVRSWGSCAGLSTEMEALQTYNGPLAVCRQPATNVSQPACNPMDPSGTYEWQMGSWRVLPLRAFPPTGDNPQGRARYTFYAPSGRLAPGAYQLYYLNRTSNPATGEISTNYEPVADAVFQLPGFGGVYTLVVGISDSVLADTATNVAVLHQLSPPNFLSIIWQMPQYFLITIASIMFCITGMEFAYTQAPQSMKTLFQAIWLFHLGVGEYLGFLLATVEVRNLAFALILCTLGLFLLVVILAAMAIYCYRYTTFTTIEEDRQRLLRADLGLDNGGFQKSPTDGAASNTYVTRL